MQTAPSGPGDTPRADTSSPGGPSSVSATGIATGQTGSSQGGSQATDAGVEPGTSPGSGGVGGFTGAGGDLFSGSQAGAGFTGTGGTGFDTPPIGTLPQPGMNTPPVASFSVTPACLPEQETSVTVTSTSLDADGDPLLCAWTMPAINTASDNGCSASGNAFINADAIPIELSVRDPSGATAVASAMIVRCPQ